MEKKLKGYQIVSIFAVFILLGASLITITYAQTNECDEFIFNWFQLNDCLGGVIGGSHTVEIFNIQNSDNFTSSNSTIIANIQNGNITSYNGTLIDYFIVNGSTIDLDELSDVVIISPATNETLTYNGTHWVNTSPIIFNDTTIAINIGGLTASDVLKNQTGSTLYFRGITAGSCIAVSENDDDIQISNTCGESTKIISIGSGTLLKISPDGANGAECQDFDVNASDCIKSLNAGTGISITNDSSTVTITNSAPDNTSCANLGTVGEGVYVSDECNFKKLLAGSSISLSSNGTRITITNSAPDDTTCANVGAGSNVYKDGECNFRSLISDDTATLALTQNTNDVTFSPVLKKLCETTASGGETSLTCTLSTSTGIKTIYITAMIKTTDASTVFRYRFNGDSGSNYAARSSSNGGADATATGGSDLLIAYPSGTGSLQIATELWCSQPDSSLEKLCYGHRFNNGATGSGTAGGRLEITTKWVNTSNWISTIDLARTAGTGTLTQYSYITVWGYA